MLQDGFEEGRYAWENGEFVDRKFKSKLSQMLDASSAEELPEASKFLSTKRTESQKQSMWSGVLETETVQSAGKKFLAFNFDKPKEGGDHLARGSRTGYEKRGRDDSIRVQLNKLCLDCQKRVAPGKTAPWLRLVKEGPDADGWTTVGPRGKAVKVIDLEQTHQPENRSTIEEMKKSVAMVAQLKAKTIEASEFDKENVKKGYVADNESADDEMLSDEELTTEDIEALMAGGFETAMDSAGETMYNSDQELRQAMGLPSSTKVCCKVIFLSEEYLANVEVNTGRTIVGSKNHFQFPLIESKVSHLKPLYIQAHIEGRPISRVLIDNGATVNIMPLALLRKIHKSENDLVKTNITISGFAGELTIAKGVLPVELQVGSRSQRVAFLVVESNASYSILLGRDWIHSWMCVPSTLHQKLIFWNGKEMEEVVAEEKPFAALVNCVDAIVYEPEMETSQSDASSWAKAKSIKNQTNEMFNCNQIFSIPSLDVELDHSVCQLVCPIDDVKTSQMNDKGEVKREITSDLHQAGSISEIDI